MAAVQETAPAADADSPGDCLALLAPSTTGGGRAVVAARDLEPGTTVLASLPAAAVVHDHLRPLRCARCLNRQPTVKNLSRCVQCKQVWYCSKGCQVADWKAGHKAECRHMASLGSGPALTDALLLMRCYRLLKQHFKSPGEPGDARCVLVGDSPQPLPHPAVPYQHSWPDVAGMAVPEHATKPPHSTMSQQLVVHMASVGAVPQKSMAVLAGCLAAFRSNNFSVTDDMVVSQAAGVYPLGALLNHSCAPNCIMTYDLRTQVQSVRTVCAVPAGTELTHPYLDPMTPRARRQRELQEEYGFSCSCRLCSVTHSSGSAQEASATSRPATAAGMWSLSTATLPPAEAAAWGSDVRSELKVGLDVASVLAVADELVAKAVELAEGEEDVPDRELALLRQATMLKASVLHPLNHALLPLHNRCKQAAMLAGDATAAAEHAAVALALYVHIYATSWPDLSQEAGGLDSADDVTSAAPSPSLPLHPLVALELSLLGELLQASAAAAGWWTGPLPTLHPEATWILQVLPSDLTSLQCAAKAIAEGVYGPQHAMAK